MRAEYQLLPACLLYLGRSFRGNWADGPFRLTVGNGSLRLFPGPALQQSDRMAAPPGQPVLHLGKIPGVCFLENAPLLT